MRHLILFLLLASVACAAPATVTVPVTLTADQAAILAAWCDTVSMRESRAVFPPEQCAVFVGEALRMIHAQSVQQEAQRQQELISRKLASEKHPALRRYQQRVAKDAEKALAEAEKQKAQARP